MKYSITELSKLGITRLTPMLSLSLIIVMYLAALPARANAECSEAEVARQALEVSVRYANKILEQQGRRDGGRRVLEFVRDETVPQYAALLRCKLIKKNASEMVPFVDVGLAASVESLNRALRRNDHFLNGQVFEESDVATWAQAMTQANQSLAARLEADIAIDPTLAGSWILKTLWDILAEGVGSLPVIGDILRQLLGAAHSTAHS